jgi:hypothetical protein
MIELQSKCFLKHHFLPSVVHSIALRLAYGTDVGDTQFDTQKRLALLSLYKYGWELPKGRLVATL